jgi:succinate-semialdehyde dehydrogenase / glutarate-semialdehyde dehydrogenase
LGGGFFVPTVFADETTDMVITKEETFGPVAPLYRFKTDAEAIEMTKDTNSVSPPISTVPTSAASGASPRPSNTASSASLKASPGLRSCRSAAWRKAASAHLRGHWGSKYGIEEFLEVKNLCMGGTDR